MYICIRYQYKNNQDVSAATWDYSGLNKKWKWKWIAGKYSANENTNYEWFVGPAEGFAIVIKYLRERFAEITNDGDIENFEITADKLPK